jgi:glycosyltransferase involved in cell wall biosynthesis
MPVPPQAIGVLVILAAPNVSEQMGGEAMKALQIFLELRRMAPQTLQITHARNRAELSARSDMAQVRWVEDTAVSRALWRVPPLRALLGPWFSWQSVRLASRIARQQAGQRVVLWQTLPNSPVFPRATLAGHLNVAGPINGNIYCPPVFQPHETRSARLRRLLHMPLQRLLGGLGLSLRRLGLIFVAGGERTRVSLAASGCNAAQMIDSLDCGVKASLLERPRTEQRRTNGRYVHFGRLVFHKGTRLIIEAVKRADPLVSLDIVGRGPELAACQLLVAQLGLGERVRFIDWYPSHEELLDTLSRYRGLVLPSIEDANGMVVQEAMALGLPAICLDWGGPQLLIEDGVNGYLVPAGEPDRIAADLAERMQRLAADGDLAERMSVAARQQAQAWRWDRTAQQWLDEILQRMNQDAARAARRA